MLMPAYMFELMKSAKATMINDFIFSMLNV
jgi:hypothetical protein